MSLIGADRRWIHQSLQVFPQSKIRRIKVRRSWRPVDWASASYLLFTEVCNKWSDNAEKIWWCPIMHESPVLPLMKRHIFQEYWSVIHPPSPKKRQVSSLKMPSQIFTRPYLSGRGGRARDSVVGWGTMLHAGRKRDRIPMRSLDFSIDLILPASLWLWGGSLELSHSYGPSRPVTGTPVPVYPLKLCNPF
jgi:hypothetical protein